MTTKNKLPQGTGGHASVGAVLGLLGPSRRLSTGFSCAISSACPFVTFGTFAKATLLLAIPLVLFAMGNCHAQTPLSGIAKVTAGLEHTCALTTTGGAKCWGYNSDAQLGDGSSTQRLIPVDVSGLTSGISAITAGRYHSCALTNVGGIKCWGLNSTGQLGDNSPVVRRFTPVDVFGLASGANAIAAGSDHTCALTIGGAVKCWGYNASGQLGDNSTMRSISPVDVSGLASGITAIATSRNHSCALTSAGGVKCWGSNGSGQLGDNSTTQRLVPVDVSGLTSGVSAIAAGGSHTCALTSSGGVKCWGSNGNGQLGDNSTTQRLIAVDVVGLTISTIAIAAGGTHTCALSSDGGLKCWGFNGDGRLGDNSTTQRNAPVDVSTLTSGVGAIAGGDSHTCAVTIGGGVKCWGQNIYGQLGDYSTSPRQTPVDVLTLALSAVQSRKTHGTAGTFDLLVDRTQDITGTVTVEPRTIGVEHSIVFQFDDTVTKKGVASVVTSSGMTIGISSAIATGSVVVVTLVGIANNSRLTISLVGVNDALNVSASIGFLVGDVNGTGSVNSSDISAVKARSGQVTNASNFRFDLNATGAINSSDISAVKARSGMVLSP